MSEKMMHRVVCIVMALFPALWGIFSFMNNITDFHDTAVHAVGPLLSMTDTYVVPGQMWRALNASWVAYAGMGTITTMETLAGIFGFLGLTIMIRYVTGSYEGFTRGKAWAMLGAACAVLVWGIGFMVVAGDWFMAWQASVKPLDTQLGAMIYAVPNILTIVILMLQHEAGK